MSVKERLKEFINYKGISVRSFEAKCGFSYGYIANMRVSMQPEKVTSIAERYPELNTGWLLTGEGDMLKNYEQDSKIVHSSSVPYEFVQAMIDERKRHDEMNAELIRQNGELIDILQERKKTDARMESAARCADARGSGLEK